MPHSSSRTFRMHIAYDGTEFSGWQIQPNSLSIQQLIEEGLMMVLRTPLRVIGSGRTDAGVHAAEQVAHFYFGEAIDCSKLLFALNSLLPKTVRIKTIFETDRDFHAQYSATGKIYHYRICLNPVEDPFQRFYRHHIPRPFDLDALGRASRRLIGKHDFSSFANKATTGSAGKNPVRTLQRIDCVEEEGGIRLEFEADGFLYKMVRNITGTLIDVGLGKLTPEEPEKALHAKDRKAAGIAAPARGLILVKVHYLT